MKLLQERYVGDGWRVLVVSVLLNRTTGPQVEGVLDELFRLWPTAADMAFAEGLEEVIRPLGLWRQRARALRRLSALFLLRPPVTADDVLGVPGCGPYAAEVWALLVEGRRDFMPRDAVLKRWLFERIRVK